MNRQKKRGMFRILYGLVSIIMAFFLLFITIEVIKANSDINYKLNAIENRNVYLPLIFASNISPAGSYYCLEYEFGLIWSSETVILENDGTSLYLYPQNSKPVTGTWSYIQPIHEVSFTNFRWLTATFEIPNRLSNRKYLEQPGFWISISCTRQ